MASTATPGIPVPIPAPSLPDLSGLAVPDGHKILCKAHAKGFQIYSCNAETHSFGAVRPEALLVADGGQSIHHFAGPTWQAEDGSLVTGKLLSKAAAPEADAIPWLLLAATPGGTPDGMLSKVAFIQRV